MPRSPVQGTRVHGGRHVGLVGRGLGTSDAGVEDRGRGCGRREECDYISGLRVPATGTVTFTRASQFCFLPTSGETLGLPCDLSSLRGIRSTVDFQFVRFLLVKPQG